MEEPVFVKCEPAWSSDTEEHTNFENSQLVPEMIPLKHETEPGPAFEEHVELESAAARVKEEMKSKLAEPGLSQNTYPATEPLELSNGPGQELNVGLGPPTKGQQANNSDIEPDAIQSDVMDLLPVTLSVHQGYYLSMSQEQPVTFVKTEITTEEHTLEQLVTRIKEENSVDNVAVLSTGQVDSYEACCSTVTPISVKSKLQTHKEQTPYSCAVCDVVFSEKFLLEKHLLKYSSHALFCCSICSGTFSTKSHLKTHIRTHYNERPHCCTLCGSKFSQSSNLKSHMRTHFDERPHCCALCGRKFSRKTHLESHRLTHYKEKPYSCTLCSGKFSHKSTLHSHLKIHSVEKCYSCTLCSRKFSLKTYLSKHMQTHSNEKPHCCTHCERTFSRKGSLKRHMLVVHCRE